MPSSSPSFAKVADAYEAYRLGYTGLVWEHLARRCGLVEGADVIDLGCGTGLSSRPLIDRGANVVGIEPDEVMLARAEATLGDRARFLRGRAEELPLPDASADLVVSAQAAHWFEEPDASDELLRVLRPGGYIAYVWKYPTPETPYTYLVDEIATRLTGRSLLAGAIYGIGTVSQLLRPGLEGYSRVTFEQPIAYTVERYVGYVSSRERIRQLLGTRMDELLGELGERIAQLEPTGAFIEQNLAYVVSARRSAAP
ncbi:MAG TPA: class I SAM-dependent methyltransferase [Gaiellales bacterium]|jgi:ubiquinone/menaquinone biosynthesis C-methylase UbiE